uniref:Uncharacterized protein n=1 Tax=Cacopsylla melanoneura TaxID=428564 RepID=A0A8D8U2M3_9HEMI
MSTLFVLTSPSTATSSSFNFASTLSTSVSNSFLLPISWLRVFKASCIRSDCVLCSFSSRSILSLMGEPSSALLGASRALDCLMASFRSFSLNSFSLDCHSFAVLNSTWHCTDANGS